MKMVAGVSVPSIPLWSSGLKKIKDGHKWMGRGEWHGTFPTALAKIVCFNKAQIVS